MKKHLSNAVPPVPEPYMQKMDVVLKAISDMEHIKRHRYSYGALAAVLALLIALAGLAYAASQSGILDRLFPGAPPPVMEQAIVRNAATDSAEGVTLSLDEYLYDDATLNLQWTVTSERDEPVYYLVECAGDEEHWSHGSGSLPMDIEAGDFQPLGALDDELDTRACTNYLRTLHNSADSEVRLNVYVFTSPLKPVRLPSPDPDSDDWLAWDYDAMRHREARGELGLSTWNVARISDYHLLFLGMAADGHGIRQIQPGRYGDAGYMRPLATLSIAVQRVTNKELGFWHTEPVERSFAFSGGRIEVDELDFNPSVSRMRYRLYPNVPIGANYISKHSMGVLLSEQGEVINRSASSTYSPDGNDIEIEVVGDPMSAPPVFIYLVPGLTQGEYDSAAENDTFMDCEKIRIDLMVK